MVTKTQFLSGVYTRRNHVPSVDLGAFDITVNPKKGRVDVTTRVHLLPQNPASQLKLTKFGEQFAKLVPQAWDQRVKFICTEAGWHDIVLKPYFKIDVVGISNAHFRISILDETAADHLQGPIAAVKPSTFTGLGADPAFAPRMGEFGAQSNLTKGEISGYRRDTIFALAQAQLVPLKGSPTQDPLGRQRLEKFAREINVLKVPRKFKSSRRPTLTVRGCGPGDRQKLASAAAGWLCACGVKNPITLAGDGDTAKAAGVELSFSKGELDAMFPKKTAGQDSLFAQVTVAHEYGHMLGLPDEYLCMSPLTEDAMQDVFALTAPEIQSFKGSTGNRIADIKKLPDGTVNVPHIVRHQAAFVRLCGDAGLTPPGFGTTTTSLMSTGMVFHPHHFVTLWEAVRMATAVNGWRLVLDG